jgi:uroporphyrinogen-III synthase
MDSEGLLARPPLRDSAGRCIGLVTAPGGRNRLAPALRARGAEVRRADVYERTPATIARARWHALAAALVAPTRVVLALSSSEALEAVLRQRPADLETPLRAVAVTAASERLAQAARDAGFRRITIAADARPASLLRAAADAFV